MKGNTLISRPVRSINGTISVPGDKSISHRSIIFGAIAKGTTRVSGFLDGEDCIATLTAFKSMGVHIEGPNNQELLIHGVGKYGLRAPKSRIDCGNSGTSMRLLAGLLAGQSFNSELTGDESLLKRPMLRISNPLTSMGAKLSTKDGKPPISIYATNGLHGIDYTMPEASAQVKSCLLLAGLYAKGITRITETCVSRDHTERMLSTFAYPLIKEENTLIINAQSACHATEITVPGDMSSAAFFIVAASIIPGSDITIRNVGINPTRIGVIHILREMGAQIAIQNQRQFGEEPVADIRIVYSPLRGVVIDPTMVALAIDEFPIIFIAAACAKGTTELHGAKELRLKESDRIGAMVEGLLTLGIDAQALDDGVIIQGGNLQGGKVDSKKDHRIAMSFLIAGAVSSKEITVTDCTNIATSFPNFVKIANSLSFCMEDLNNNV